MNNKFGKAPIAGIAAAGLGVLAAPTAAANYTHSAISIGNNGTVWALAQGYTTWQAAAAAANRRCGYTDCGWLVVWPSGMCGAAALAPSGHWAGARGHSLAYAQRVAVHNAGFGAVVEVSSC